MDDLFKYDITFCSNEKCERKDCKRHWENTPKGIPYSVFLIEDIDNYDTDNCTMYFGEE